MSACVLYRTSLQSIKMHKTRYTLMHSMLRHVHMMNSICVCTANDFPQVSEHKTKQNLALELAGYVVESYQRKHETKDTILLSRAHHGCKFNNARDIAKVRVSIFELRKQSSIPPDMCGRAKIVKMFCTA